VNWELLLRAGNFYRLRQELSSEQISAEDKKKIRAILAYDHGAVWAGALSALLWMGIGLRWFL
jgi:hypothetical protein